MHRFILTIIILNKINIIYSQNDAHKFIDIYTNDPNLETVLNEEKLSKILSKNFSRRQDEDVLEFNAESADFRANYRPHYVQIQSEKYLDPEIPQTSPKTHSHLHEPKKSKYQQNPEYLRIPEMTDYSRSLSMEPDFSHVQKISRSSTDNSKQLESSSANFFTKINTVIRDQFSRLFKFGGTKPNDGIKPTLQDELTNGHENARRPPVEAKGNTKVAKKRFLNIFTILQFENSRCEAQGGGTTYEGTCYHRLECGQLEGVSMGACAKGYGVCCIFRYTCGATTNQNTSYFECDNTNGQNPVTQTPTIMPPLTTVPDIDPRLNMSALVNKYQEWGRQSTTGGICLFTVNKRLPDVKQIRIDFLDFDLRGPTNGECNTDRLVITGGNANSRIPAICGYNTGQHLYVDVSDVPGPIQLAVTTANPAEKRFRIRISQLRAPCANFMNCLQYYTGATGTIQTFNYDPSPRGFGVGQYFNNLNYAICIRKEPGFCTITYSNVQNGVESPFRLMNVDANGNILIPPGQAGAEIFNCPDDYIVVNGVRLCGDKLNDGSTNADFRVNAPVTDLSGGPFILPVRTSRMIVARGFKLYYTQNRCTT